MKSVILFIVSIFIFAGCSAFEPSVITTDGNNFSSSKFPAINIELDKEFEYIGTYDNKFEAQTLGYTGQTISTKKNTYLYAQISSEKYLNKLFGISILELPAGRNWHPNTMLVIKNPLKEAIVDIGGKKFQYAIKVKQATNRLTQQFLLDKGIISPRCYMSMLVGRVFGNNIKMYISYYEDISMSKDSGIKSCADWQDKEMLTEKQEEYLKEFEERAIASIKIF